jgi:hypothetical protein
VACCNSLPLGPIIKLLRALEDKRISCGTSTESTLTIHRGQVGVVYNEALVAGVDPEAEAEDV